MQELLNYEQAAKYLNLKPHTLRVWVMNKKIPYLKIGSAVRFNREDLVDWVNAHLVESTN